MRRTLFILASVFVFLGANCYAATTWKVVDAETGAPIEEAIVLVEWTKTKGLPGLTYTESYEVIEAVTDSEGRVKVSRIHNPFVNRAHVTVYKKGYAAWNNRMIFPEFKKRTDFKWENGYVFRLERFRDEYSYVKHIKFLRNSMRVQNLESKKKFYDAIAWETDMAQREREDRSKAEKPKRK
jgi:hypothetical protein